jgi:SLT domain-containing protein
MPASDIWNPVLEGVAALRYIKNQYGSPYNIPGLLSGNYGGYASGTSSARPGWAWVGEHGPELLRFRGGEQVYPAGTAAAGNTYHIHIAPTPLARPADVGREVVGAIREFEKRAGKSWRS